MINKLREKIASQQAGKEKTPVFYVGEQIKDICEKDSKACEIVLQDLENEKMSIAECEKLIQAYAKKNGGCTPPQEADRIIREFYGISNSQTVGNMAEKSSDFVDLSDFI